MYMIENNILKDLLMQFHSKYSIDQLEYRCKNRYLAPASTFSILLLIGQN